jgi:hypothetical protein
MAARSVDEFDRSPLRPAVGIDLFGAVAVGWDTPGRAPAMGAGADVAEREEISRGRVAGRSASGGRPRGARGRRPKPRKLAPACGEQYRPSCGANGRRSRSRPGSGAAFLTKGGIGCHTRPPIKACISRRGVLKKELLEHLRGKAFDPALAPCQPKARGLGQIKDAVSNSGGPALIDDRAVPSHWEGDLSAARETVTS